MIPQILGGGQLVRIWVRKTDILFQKKQTPKSRGEHVGSSRGEHVGSSRGEHVGSSLPIVDPAKIAVKIPSESPTGTREERF